ncbi:adenylate/guanylate cyclase domain-containing protein [Acinetobacter baumannii]|uniref:adenylate/guanylate cyclase domain-containing protein n=1 Tax=Acinetobacter baumannii TaxID=470 RepID=UPI00233FB273|nr:adenylate/guanylate cyclase domain-containing protein [Acinetobacter baumannii]MDC5299651.1 adenylate/guanylate cyclase domain-containing protein [Acinetobacter baumannii]MDC5341253.1 adenylate/guanylate cyclase domain-containing protein [Acinetobacter baumannii]MDC5610142.1 adenylate/guanylate cyclase domain-containing protein [Acinetobacter baumannii]MDK2222645.1 adenylate/guanylate cyclase domain-containing protein [Acinetobacter baumannii]MDK2233535.1 adenylate/guanylate cyclase domain-
MSFSFSVNDFDKYFNQTKGLYDSIHSIQENKSIALDSNIGFIVGEPEQYKLQRLIREAFGKKEVVNTSNIADHPDFKSLINGGTKNQFITTMFVDIKGSTRLSLKYPNDLNFIYKFKNAVIKSCIDVIRAFDGHVHRIMGDAVLGFFGSSEINRSQSILDCLNSAAMLTVVLEHTIKPWLQSEKPDFDVKDFGFRIGCNFGDDEEVLWANYGFGNVGEISPTGLPVDLAAKLQGLANKNQIMMGQGLLEYFNFPHDFSRIKTSISGGINIENEFITPNYTKQDGSSLNYIMRLLQTHKYILGLPLPLDLKREFTNQINNNEKIISNEKFELSAELIHSSGYSEKYYSNSRVIEKNLKIKAILTAKNITLLERYKVIFYKKNHSGFKDEPELSRYLQEEIEENDLISQQINHFITTFNFQRDCNFKGLHYIRCDVVDTASNVVFRDYIYVPIM